MIKNSLTAHRQQTLGLNFLIKIIVWSPVIQMLMLLLKYSGLPYIEAAYIMKLAIAITILIAVAINLKNITRNFIYIYALFFIPTVVGMINLINPDSNHKFEFFTIHLAGSILIINSIIIFSKSNICTANQLAKEIDRAAAISLIITALYLIIYSSKALSEYLYFGPSTGILLIVFPWFIAQRKTKLALLCLILIFLGGKRAVMVSLLVEIILLSWLFGKEFLRQFSVNALKIICILLCLVISVIKIFSDIDFSTVNEFIDLASGRIFGSIEGFVDDPNKISSGRFAEIEESSNFFMKNYLTIFFGLGFGWSFFWIDESLHFLHFSPINFMYQYGIIIFSVFIIIFLTQAYLLYSYFRKTKDIIFGTLFVIFLGQLVEGFFSYMYVVNPFMWCIFGILIAMKRRKMQFSLVRF
jgi:hypothetical protein